MYLIVRNHWLKKYIGVQWLEAAWKIIKFFSISFQEEEEVGQAVEVEIEEAVSLKFQKFYFWLINF